MNLNGFLIGFGVFLMIGASHPIVIEGECYIGKQIWPLFVLFGVAALVVSLSPHGTISSALTAVLGVSRLWNILELFKQEERAKKDWFPKNPEEENRIGTLHLVIFQIERCASCGNICVFSLSVQAHVLPPVIWMIT